MVLGMDKGVYRWRKVFEKTTRASKESEIQDYTTVNILVANPNLRNGSSKKFLPTGIASVMSYVESKGLSFDLLDVDIDDLSDEEVENALQKKDYNVILTGAIVTHYCPSSYKLG